MLIAPVCQVCLCHCSLWRTSSGTRRQCLPRNVALHQAPLQPLDSNRLTVPSPPSASPRVSGPGAWAAKIYRAQGLLIVTDPMNLIRRHFGVKPGYGRAHTAFSPQAIDAQLCPSQAGTLWCRLPVLIAEAMPVFYQRRPVILATRYTTGNFFVHLTVAVV